MSGIFKMLLYLAMAIVLVAIAYLNSDQRVNVTYFPNSTVKDVPVFLVILGSVFIGVLVAGFIAVYTPKLFPQLKKGYSWAIYVAGYTVGRLWIELLRTDKATEVFGVRINVWTSVIVLAVAVAVVMRGLRDEPSDGHRNSSKSVPH